MDRRDFIKLTAITGTSAALASCGSPENQLVRFIPDEDLKPGIAEIKPGVCPLCRAGCGTTVRVMQGDAEVTRDGKPGVVTMSLAKKLDGNPTHPVNRGALCPRGQAAIQGTYHPDRLTQPMVLKGPRGSGHFEPIGWDDALKQLIQRLDALSASGARASLACWTRPRPGAREDLLSEFLRRFGAPPPSTFEFFDDDVLRRANLLSFGHAQLPTFDLAASRYVIAFGADFLGTWNAPVAQTAAFGRMRQGRPGVRGKFVQVEPRMSLTGVSADEWIAIRPGTEGVLALGLAHVILTSKLRPVDAAGRAGALIDGWSRGLAEYTPAAVEQKTGVSAARIERIAHELVEQRPALAIIGGAPLAHTNGLFQALAVNALNALVGSVGATGGMSFMPLSGRPEGLPYDSKPLRDVCAGILAAPADRLPVQLLLIDSVDPVFATPKDWRVREAMLKVPFVVSFGSFIDDTSVLADLILPDHSFLESWTDARPEAGANVALRTIAGPAMKPLHHTRATPDVLLEVARRLTPPLTPAFTSQTFDQLLQSSMSDDQWSTATSQGWTELKAQSQPGPKLDATSVKAADARFDGEAAQYPLHFLPYASQALYDGSLAHLPWLQEMPDPMTTAMWSSWVEINPRTAATLGIEAGDLVEVRSAHGAVQAPAVLFPGTAPDVIAMPVGQGHERFTRYASGRGANPIKILGSSVEPETGALAWAATRVKISRTGGKGSLVLFGASMFERPATRR